MKKENFKLIVNAFVLVVIAVLVVVSINAFVLQTPEDLIFGQKVTLESEVNIEDPSGTNYSIVDYKQTVKDEHGGTLGVIYNVKIRNTYSLSTSDLGYGYIELLVGIENDFVTVGIVSLEQSVQYVSNIQKYIYTYYDHILYSDVQDIPYYNAGTEEDALSGATASESTNAIKNEVLSAIAYEYPVEAPVDNAYADYLGEGYTLETDQAFVPTAHVTAKENIVTSSVAEGGYIYTVTGEGSYSYRGYTDIGSITLKMIFNADDEIIAIVMPEDLYEHTLSYIRLNFEYLDMFIGKTKEEITGIVDAQGDLQTGATYTKNLIDDLLAYFVSEVA